MNKGPAVLEVYRGQDFVDTGADFGRHQAGAGSHQPSPVLYQWQGRDASGMLPALVVQGEGSPTYCTHDKRNPSCSNLRACPAGMGPHLQLLAGGNMSHHHLALLLISHHAVHLHGVTLAC